MTMKVLAVEITQERPCTPAFVHQLRMLDDELTADLSELVDSAPVPPVIANEVSATPMTGGSGMTAHAGDLALFFRSLATGNSSVARLPGGTL